MFIDLTNQKPFQALFDLILFVCTECCFKYGLYIYLKTHMILHTSENEFPCCTDPNIQKPLYELFDLTMFACTECDFKCKQCCYLKPHMMLYICEYSSLCYVCNIIVMTSQPLKLLRPIYKPFPCTECDLIYPTIKPLPHPCHIITYKDILVYNIDRKCCYRILL